MALLERLQILVDGNAQGAIREFEKLGAAADRELGKTDDRLEKLSAGLTNFGAAALAGGAIAIGGLKGFADAASAYGEQVSAATVTFGNDGAAQLQKFAEAAADTANISKTEATKAANGFAAFARQAGLTGTAAVDFSTNLVQLAGDLASFKDITVDEALQALQSGLAGEGEPIRRLGGDISDVALKAELFALTGEEVTGTLTQQQKVVAINSKLFKDFELAQGDAVRTGDSLANQQRNLQANFENLKTEIGEGLLPIFSGIVGGINDVIGGFQNLPESAKGPLGAIAGFGAAGTVAIGALSLVAGQVIKFRDAFVQTTTVVVDGVETQKRQLTTLGKAAKAFGSLLAVAGAAEALFQGINAATGAAGKLETALNRLKIAGAGAGDGVESTFAGLVKAEEASLEFSNIWDGLGARIIITSDGVKGSIEEVQRAFDSVKGTDPALAGQVLDSLQLITNGLDRNSDQFQTNQEFINRNREALGLQAQAAELAGDKTGELGTELDNLNPPVEIFTSKIQGLTVQTEDATTAFEAYIDKLRASTDPFFGVIDAANNLQDANKKALEAFFALADGATPEELEAFADAQRDNVQAALDQEEAIAVLRDMVEQGKIGYGDFVTAMNEIVQRNPELLGAVQQVKDEMFFAALAAQGLDQSDPTIDVTANTEQALTKIQAVKGQLDAIAAVAGLIAEVDKFVNRPDTSNLPLPKREVAEFRDINGNGKIGRSIGGPVSPSQTYLVGEEGPELFRPRTHGSIVPNNRLGGGVNITQNITTPDPILTAAEVVRRQRDAEFLAGV